MWWQIEGPSSSSWSKSDYVRQISGGWQNHRPTDEHTHHTCRTQNSTRRQRVIVAPFCPLAFLRLTHKYSQAYEAQKECVRIHQKTLFRNRNSNIFWKRGHPPQNSSHTSSLRGLRLLDPRATHRRICQACTIRYDTILCI